MQVRRLGSAASESMLVIVITGIAALTKKAAKLAVYALCVCARRPCSAQTT